MTSYLSPELQVKYQSIVFSRFGDNLLFIQIFYVYSIASKLFNLLDLNVPDTYCAPGMYQKADFTNHAVVVYSDRQLFGQCTLLESKLDVIYHDTWSYDGTKQIMLAYLIILRAIRTVL